MGGIRGRRCKWYFDALSNVPLTVPDRLRRHLPPRKRGGNGLQSGIAWQLLQSPEWIRRGSLNCLKFLAALLGVWVEHQVGGSWAEDEVLLCQRDSSWKSGWIPRSSFGDECPLHLTIARTMAWYMSDHRLQARKIQSLKCCRGISG